MAADVIGLWNLDWPNANSQRKYPLHPSATARDVSDTFTLPNDILVGLYLPISADSDLDVERAFIRTISVYPSSLVVIVGYDNGAPSLPTLATAVVPLSGLVEYSVFPLSGVGDLDGVSGSIQIGRPSAIGKLPLGEFTFDRAGGRIDSDCIRPVIPALDGIVLVNGEDRSAVLTGIIELTAGSNIRLTSTPVFDGETLIGHQIRIDAIDGEGLNDDCICDGQQPESDPVLSINGVTAGPDGNIDITGDSCLGVTSETGNVSISDGCSKPCCGLEAVDRIREDLDRLGGGVAAQTEFANRLFDAYSRLSESVIGLKLNDVACEGL